MNIKKLSICGLFLVIAGGWFALPVFAQESGIIKMKTLTVQPLRVDFGSSSKGIVRGEVSGTVSATDIQEVLFRIKNHPQEDEIWRETLRWDEDFRTEGKIDIPFQFDVSKIAIAQRFVFAVDFLNEKGEFVASGQTGAQMSEKFADVRTSTISKLVITKTDRVKVSFLFTNGNEKQKVRPELTLTEHSVSGNTLFSFIDEPLEELSAGEQKEFTFDFAVPQNPETYVVSVRVIDNKDNVITGYLRNSFLVEGDFAEIKSIQITPERALEAGESVGFTVFGVADGTKGELEIDFTALIMPIKEGVEPLHETRKFEAVEDMFAENFTFSVPVATKEFNVTARVLRNGKVIEEKTKSYLAKKQSSRSLLNLQEEIFQRYSDGGFEVWMVLVLALAVIVLFVSILHRKKRLNLLLFVLLPFLGMSSASAAWQASWFYPVSGEVFNRQSTEGFETVVFMGSVKDSVTEVGYFQTTPTVVVQFTKGAQTINKTVQQSDIHIYESGTIYGFDVNLSDADLNALSEGNWETQIIFDGILQTSWNGSIWLDMTLPNISFSYSPNTYTNTAVAVTIACEDAIAGCLQEAGGIPDYAPFDLTVLGNFASSYENGVRGFKVCDKVGNCTSSDVEKLNIDFYDPVAPELTTGITVLRNGLTPLSGSGGFNANKMAADHIVTLSLLGANDPTESASLTQDAHACGRDSGDDTYLDTSYCTPKWFVCPVNHPVGGGGPRRDEMIYNDPTSCEDRQGTWEEIDPCGFTFTFPFVLEECITCTADPSCAATTCIGSTCEDACGNIYDGTNDCGCVPNGCATTTCVGSTCNDGCDSNAPGTMTSSTWTPATDTECSGVPFTQTGTECGETREAIGTGTGAGCCIPDIPCPSADEICIGEQCIDSCGNEVDGKKPVTDGGWTDWRWSCTASDDSKVAYQKSNIFKWFTANLFALESGGETPPPGVVARYGSRTCTNPEPSCGGANCVGDDTVMILCAEGEICRDGYCFVDTSCTPDCSCATTTCVGETCSDGCGGTCAGTRPSVDGGWSVWGSWQCTPAGAGGPSTSRYRTRSCTNPTPQCGGASCVGSATEVISCGAGEVCSAGVCVSGCTDTCASLNYECGTPTICGVTENCGDCETLYGPNYVCNEANYTCAYQDPCLPAHNTLQCWDGNVWWYNNCGQKTDLSQDCLGQGCLNGACLSSCAGISIEETHCILQTTSNGGTSGSCYAGYAGTCSYSCNNSNWSMVSANCTVNCTTHHHKGCYQGDSYWYDSCNVKEDKYADCLYGCSGGVCEPFTCGEDYMYDQEGNNYYTVQIGSQCWMEEDMATSENNVGNSFTSNEYATESGEYFYTISAAQNVCPTNWHLPTDTEWKTLEQYLGMSATEANELGWRGYPVGFDVVSELNIQYVGTWDTYYGIIQEGTHQLYWTNTYETSSCTPEDMSNRIGSSISNDKLTQINHSNLVASAIVSQGTMESLEGLVADMVYPDQNCYYARGLSTQDNGPGYDLIGYVYRSPMGIIHPGSVPDDYRYHSVRCVKNTGGAQ